MQAASEPAQQTMSISGLGGSFVPTTPPIFFVFWLLQFASSQKTVRARLWFYWTKQDSLTAFGTTWTRGIIQCPACH
ncbi:hypothetical protein B0H66DRAFT_561355 [Apodospora peruviana]|uniref:Uncharacterized protein n=1 Tax=Apodospora peruviana TaxID=516989 RepID=A0AAE0M2C2_9PEZI|nr:hypothetical protein B0H66DRAFT_561355 [Apodospora peruviana]